ncbi:MAG: bifunctional folylpolyglutamate synthase/dihydrofolate synthase, partial [Clostridia bacterium]|nr:bifunctional folylpolyglutamate synthase/dihydrofolate synthase [Clostridia bacterium]
SINGEDISDDELCDIIERIKPIADNMTDKPTEFELITAAAFLYFYEKECDLVVLECGLGGRLDSTNIIEKPLLSVITGIALDHTSILGDTIEKIATEKAGIIKENSPVLWCGKDETAYKLIKEKAEAMSAHLYCVEREKIKILEFSLNGTVFNYPPFEDIKIKLLGEYQIDNAVNVLNAVLILRKMGIKISSDAVLNGMKKAVWPSRFEIISESPIIIVDGGHNSEGIVSTVKSVRKYFGDKKLNVLTGVMQDKDYNFMSGQIAKIANKVFCIAPNNARALSAEKYAVVYNKIGIPARSFESLKEALGTAVEESNKSGAPLICLGSLYMYSEIISAKEELKL